MRRTKVVDPGQVAPIPAEPGGNGPERIAAAYNVLAGGNAIPAVTIDNAHAA